MSQISQSFIVAFAIMYTSLAINNACAQTVTSHSFGGHIYLIVNEPQSWANANAEAEKALGHLAIINSEAENQFIYTNLLALGISTTAPDGGGARYAWLGGSDAAVEGSWLWVNGTNFNSGFTKWGHGYGGNEPDNYQGAQDYLAMGLEAWPRQHPGYMGNSSEWNDLNGATPLAYIIEFDSPTRDSDNDGLTDWKEFITATAPTNATSQMEINITPKTANNIILSWSGSSLCSYNIRAKTNLLDSEWTTTTNIPGISDIMSYTNTSH